MIDNAIPHCQILTPLQRHAFPACARRSEPVGRPLVSDLPRFQLANLTVHQSDSSDCPGLRVKVFKLPTQGHFIATECSPDRYHFQYRPRTDQGRTRLSIASLGITAGHIDRDGLWLVPPGLCVESEWTSSSGSVAAFFFTPDFLRGLADQLGLPGPFLSCSSPTLFFADQLLESLCRLLVIETEDCCLQGPLYFEALAHALALSLLHRVRYAKSAIPQRAPSVPPGVRAVIRALEGTFWERRSVDEMARVANLSVSHFTRGFQQVTGLTPHRYLLNVRLGRARQLIAQRTPALSLADIAAKCGFSDQAHLGRHFRRVFGMTPAAFRRATQERADGLKGNSTSGPAPVLPPVAPSLNPQDKGCQENGRDVRN